MKFYQAILVFCFLLLILSCSNKNSEIQKNSAQLSVNLKLLKEYYVPDSIYIGYDYESLPKHINNKRYDIQISLENNTDSIIGIVMMTCSWYESFIINTPLFDYVNEDCNSNYPHHISIKPHEATLLITTLEKSKHIIECETCPDYSKSQVLKLGFIYIPEKEASWVTEYHRIMWDKSLWNVIWSSPLTLEK